MSVEKFARKAAKEFVNTRSGKPGKHSRMKKSPHMKGRGAEAKAARTLKKAVKKL